MTTPINDLALNQRVKKLDAMYRMIDFLKENPDIPAPFFGQMDAFSYDSDSLPEIARAMKPVTKEVSDTFYVLRRSFGNGVNLHVNFARDEVCERIVTGTEEVPEKVIEAYTKEIVEWVCPDTILATS